MSAIETNTTPHLARLYYVTWIVDQTISPSLTPDQRPGRLPGAFVLDLLDLVVWSWGTYFQLQMVEVRVEGIQDFREGWWRSLCISN